MTTRRHPRMRRELTAWTFVAPALAALGLFFALPVAAALLLSFTDFDIYALADLGNLRFVGFDNYIARSEEHTSELQSLMRISYSVFRLKKNIPIIKIVN